MPLSDNAARRKDDNHANFRDFQHRHYAGVAGIIASIDDPHVRGFAARRFADAFGANPNFDRRRFMIAAIGDLPQ